jgi:hypothetical protein
MVVAGGWYGMERWLGFGKVEGDAMRGGVINGERERRGEKRRDEMTFATLRDRYLVVM